MLGRLRVDSRKSKERIGINTEVAKNAEFTESEWNFRHPAVYRRSADSIERKRVVKRSS
jgi:hypothetical protein